MSLTLTFDPLVKEGVVCYQMTITCRRGGLWSRASFAVVSPLLEAFLPRVGPQRPELYYICHHLSLHVWQALHVLASGDSRNRTCDFRDFTPALYLAELCGLEGLYFGLLRYDFWVLLAARTGFEPVTPHSSGGCST